MLILEAEFSSSMEIPATIAAIKAITIMLSLNLIFIKNSLLMHMPAHPCIAFGD
jgi:hypothetical protein